jgi:hypothetical protein
MNGTGLTCRRKTVVNCELLIVVVVVVVVLCTGRATGEEKRSSSKILEDQDVDDVTFTFSSSKGISSTPQN